MYIFTQQQIDEIKDRLAMLGIKDTQFPQADTPLTGQELLAIVQNNTNKKVSLFKLFSEFAAHVEGIEKGDIFNVSQYAMKTEPTEESVPFTLQGAVNYCPDDVKRGGQIISFVKPDGEWVAYQFTDTDISNWNDITKWDKFIKEADAFPTKDSDNNISSGGMYDYMQGINPNDVYETDLKSITNDIRSITFDIPVIKGKAYVIYIEANNVHHDGKLSISTLDGDVEKPLTETFSYTDLCHFGDTNSGKFAYYFISKYSGNGLIVKDNEGHQPLLIPTFNVKITALPETNTRFLVPKFTYLMMLNYDSETEERLKNDYYIRIYGTYRDSINTIDALAETCMTVVSEEPEFGESVIENRPWKYWVHANEKSPFLKFTDYNIQYKVQSCLGRYDTTSSYIEPIVVDYYCEVYNSQEYYNYTKSSVNTYNNFLQYLDNPATIISDNVKEAQVSYPDILNIGEYSFVVYNYYSTFRSDDPRYPDRPSVKLVIIENGKGIRAELTIAKDGSFPRIERVGNTAVVRYMKHRFNDGIRDISGPIWCHREIELPNWVVKAEAAQLLNYNEESVAWNADSFKTMLKNKYNFTLLGNVTTFLNSDITKYDDKYYMLVSLGDTAVSSTVNVPYILMESEDLEEWTLKVNVFYVDKNNNYYCPAGRTTIALENNSSDGTVLHIIHTQRDKRLYYKVYKIDIKSDEAERRTELELIQERDALIVSPAKLFKYKGKIYLMYNIFDSTYLNNEYSMTPTPGNSSFCGRTTIQLSYIAEGTTTKDDVTIGTYTPTPIKRYYNNSGFQDFSIASNEGVHYDRTTEKYEEDYNILPPLKYLFVNCQDSSGNYYDSYPRREVTLSEINLKDLNVS